MQIPYWLDEIGAAILAVALAVGAAIGFAVVITLLYSLAAAIPTYFLWNWLMPAIFGLKAITLGQAFGLNILAAILIGSKVSYTNK